MSKKVQIILKNGIEYVYQPIHFKTAIMQEYYVGNDFIGLINKKNFDERELSELIHRAGVNGFMPKLVSELKEIIGIKGKDIKLYDGYEFGGSNDKGIDEVSFYFLIKRDNYDKVMKDIKYWSIAKGLDHLIYFDVKNIQYA